MNYYRERWIDRVWTGHLNLGPVTVYGANAMHWALEIHIRGHGYLCAHPTTKTFGAVWPWYVYLSPNATPGSAKWGIGPGFDGPRKRPVRNVRVGR